MIDCFLIGSKAASLSRTIKLFIKLCRFLPRKLRDSKSFIFYHVINPNCIKYQNELYTVSEIIDRVKKDRDVSNMAPGAPAKKDGASLTIAYLASFLKRRGFTVDFINQFRGEHPELITKLQNQEILTVAISTTFLSFDYQVREIVRWIRKTNRRAGRAKTKIIVGGPFIMNQFRNTRPQKFLRMLKKIQADFYVISPEGEAALTEIISALKENQPYDQIKNIVYQTANGYICNPIQPEKNSLEENPVEWEQFKNSLGRQVEMRSSKSCPFRCSFCIIPELEGQYQYVPVEMVERDLTMLHHTGTVDKFFFIDDTFNVPPERFKDILRMMIKNNYRFQWGSFLRCQFLDRETVELMKESGYKLAFLGIESGNQQILNNMNKHVTVEGLQAGIRLLNEYEIDSVCSIIIGFPGETIATAQDSLRFVEESRPTFCSINTWYAYPGTPIFREREKYQLKGREYFWSHSTMDSKTAVELVNQAYLSLKNTTLLPTIDSFSILLGLDGKAIRNLLEVFHHEVKQKLMNPRYRGMDPKEWEQMVERARVVSLSL